MGVEGGQGAGGGEEPAQGTLDLGGIAVRVGKVGIDVFDGGFQHGQAIVELVETRPCDHQFGVTEPELC